LTKEQLRSYRSIKSHVNMLKAQRDDLILRSSARTGEGVKHSGVSKPVENITEKREKIEERIAEQEAELDEIKRYIDGCEEYFGTMLRLHYIEGKTWTSIALRMGGKNTKESVRKACHRYIEKSP